MNTASPIRKASCPGCAATYTVPAHAVAAKARCRVCQAIFSLDGEAVPAPKLAITTSLPFPPVLSCAAPVTESSAVPVSTGPSAVQGATELAPEPSAEEVPHSPLGGVGKRTLALIVSGIFVLLALAWPGMRHICALGTGPERRKYLPRIALGTLAVLVGLTVGTESLCGLFSSSTKDAIPPPLPPPPPPDWTAKTTPLKVRPRKVERPLTLDVAMNFTGTDNVTGTKHAFGSNFAAQFRELTQNIDDEGETDIRLECRGCTLAFTMDGDTEANLLLNQKEMIANLHRMVIAEKLSKHNDAFYWKADVSQVPEEYQDNVRPNANRVGMFLQMLTVSLPDQEVAPGATGEKSSTFAMGSTKGEKRTRQTRYTYRGIQTRNGREEAVIDMKMTMLTKQGEGTLKGNGKGEAVFDLSARQFSRVNLTLDLELDTNLVVIDSNSRAKGTVNLSLQRDLAGAR